MVVKTNKVHQKILSAQDAVLEAISLTNEEEVKKSLEAAAFSLEKASAAVMEMNE